MFRTYSHEPQMTTEVIVKALLGFLESGVVERWVVGRLDGRKDQDFKVL